MNYFGKLKIQSHKASCESIGDDQHSWINFHNPDKYHVGVNAEHFEVYGVVDVDVSDRVFRYISQAYAKAFLSFSRLSTYQLGMVNCCPQEYKSTNP